MYYLVLWFQNLVITLVKLANWNSFRHGSFEFDTLPIRSVRNRYLSAAYVHSDTHWSSGKTFAKWSLICSKSYCAQLEGDAFCEGGMSFIVTYFTSHFNFDLNIFLKEPYLVKKSKCSAKKILRGKNQDSTIVGHMEQLLGLLLFHPSFGHFEFVRLSGSSWHDVPCSSLFIVQFFVFPSSCEVSRRKRLQKTPGKCRTSWVCD